MIHLYDRRPCGGDVTASTELCGSNMSFRNAGIGKKSAAIVANRTVTRCTLEDTGFVAVFTGHFTVCAVKVKAVLQVVIRPSGVGKMAHQNG